MSILKLSSEALSSPAVAGQIEYSSPVIAATPIGIQRGVIPAAQFFRLDSGLAGANVNTAQNVFGVGVTLSSSTVYAFEALYILNKTAGTTSHTISLGFGGTATVNNIAYVATGGGSTTATGQTTLTSQYLSAASTALTGAITSATVYTDNIIRGTVSINAGGTFIPQYTLSAAPGGAYTTQAGSYFLIYPIGASGANTSVGTWA